MPTVDATTAAKAATSRNGGFRSQTLNGSTTISRSKATGNALPLHEQIDHLPEVSGNTRSKGFRIPGDGVEHALRIFCRSAV